MGAPEPDPETIAAVGKVTEALEWVERARGHLYDFHHLMGHADAVLQEAVAALEAAGAAAPAARLSEELVGRDVLEDRWTYRIVEEFDDGYWMAFRREEEAVRVSLTGGRRHVAEAQLRKVEQGRH